MKAAGLTLVLALAVMTVSCVPTARAEVLSAGIAHSEFLPAVTPQIAAGINAAAQGAPALDWFPIPGFMAGSWTKRGDLTVSESDAYGNTRPMNEWTDNEMNVSWGTQTDNAGEVWHLNLLPTIRVSRSANLRVHFVTVAMKCEHTEAKQMVTRTRYIVTEYYGESGQVANEFQQESLNTYTLLKDGEMENTSSNRIYDLAGRPSRSGTLVSKFTRTGPFVKVAGTNGIDYARSLNEYLSEHGLSRLTTQPAATRAE